MKREDSNPANSGTSASQLQRNASIYSQVGSMGIVERTTAQDWLRIHRRLVELETEFSEIAMRAASGEISIEELEKERAQLVGMRDLCSAVYEKAFGFRRLP